MANPVIHIEHLSSNVEQGKKFYTSLFDWKVEDMPVPGAEPYQVVKAEQGPNIGFFTIPGDTHPSWLTYVRVDDIKASVAKAKQLGASVVEDIVEFGDYGWACVLSDPAGAVFAIWQYRENQAEH
ncbi:MAG: VOC family protein [Methylophilaceae bacterium]